MRKFLRFANVLIPVEKVIRVTKSHLELTHGKIFQITIDYEGTGNQIISIHEDYGYTPGNMEFDRIEKVLNGDEA